MAFIIGLSIQGTRLEWLTPYVDPGVLTIVAIALLPVPVATLRKALSEIALVTPPALKARVDEVAAEVARKEGFEGHLASVAQQGRARTIEIEFRVAPGSPARPLEEWDRIRSEVRDSLGGEDPHSWITIYFTTVTG